MRDTILFDLDGTLLPMDLDLFLKLYFYHIGDYFKDRLDPKLLAKYIMASTEVTIMNKDGRSNEDKFMTSFEGYINDDVEWYKDQFISFYQTEFKNVQASTTVSSEIVEAIQILKDKGYTLAIATNPLFPMVANQERIKWAGIDINDFSYVSCFEENHYTKPHIEYYQEVLQSINKKPEDCYMVGNDVLDDLTPQHLGVETYIITNHLVNSKNLENTSDHTGTYKDFLQFVKDLPAI